MTDLTAVIKPKFLKALGEAYQNHQLGLIMVVTNEMIQDLSSDKATCSILENGGVVILVPQKAVEAVYK